MQDERTIVQAHEDRAYLHQGMQNLLGADNPKEVEFMGRLLRIWNESASTIQEAAVLAAEERSLMAPGDEKPSPESWAVLRLFQAAAVADKAKIDAAASFLGSAALPDTIEQFEIDHLRMLYQAYVEADRCVERFSLSLLERLEAGAAVESGEHTLTFESKKDGQSLVINGEDLYCNPYKPSDKERKRHRMPSDEDTGSGALHIR